MADAKKKNAAQEFLEKYGEKLALAISLAILVAYAIMAFGMSSEEPSLGLVDKNIRTIDKEEKTAHKEKMPPDSENWQARAIGPWSSVVTTARPPDDWSGHLVTRAVGRGIVEPVAKRIPVLVPTVSFGGAEVNIDNIAVTWNYKDFSPQELQKMARSKEKTEAAKASYFVLERQANGSGKWEVLADKLDTKTLSYVDSKIDPKARYAYRVTAYCTEKNYLERGGKLDDEIGATPNPTGLINTSAGKPVETLGLWKLSFSNATKPADAAKGMVYVKIEKFEKGYGKVEKSHIHYDGDQIGFWEESAGADPTSKHRVASKGGRAIEVDFNMGATLISVNPVKLAVDVKRCKPIYNPDGTKKDCQIITEKRNFDTALVTYKDDEGVHKVYVPSPNILDQLCEEHGGRKITTSLPPDTSKPDEPKVDPKEQARMKREADAEKLFDEAEKNLDKNKSTAVAYYQRLLGEYKDTEFVANNKKAIIEERLASLKKTK